MEKKSGVPTENDPVIAVSPMSQFTKLPAPSPVLFTTCVSPNTA